MRNETAMQSNSAHFVKNANLSHFTGGMNLLKTGQAGATHCSYPQGLNKNSTKRPRLVKLAKMSCKFP